jgi:hypothetical protein
MIPRFPVNVPLCGIATMSPNGLTRFCKCIAWLQPPDVLARATIHETPPPGRAGVVESIKYAVK